MYEGKRVLYSKANKPEEKFAELEKGGKGWPFK